VPTNRKRRDRGRLDALTHAQEAHLCTGHYFFDFRDELDHFRDEAHRRRAWALHRDEILQGWDHPGRRPHAFWEYDCGLEPGPGSRDWSWPKPIETEAEMVHRLIQLGEIDGCTLNGVNRISSELREIEDQWRRDIRAAVICEEDVPKYVPISMTHGCPAWFYRKHTPQILAELRADRAAWDAMRHKGAELGESRAAG
jgi:hypothetical protein